MAPIGSSHPAAYDLLIAQAITRKEFSMHIKPPGTPQQIAHQPELHTFIGDTPLRPDPSELEPRDANFSAVRAYSERHLIRVADDNDDTSAVLDIRTAPAAQQAHWVNLSVQAAGRSAPSACRHAAP